MIRTAFVLPLLCAGLALPALAQDPLPQVGNANPGDGLLVPPRGNATPPPIDDGEPHGQPHPLTLENNDEAPLFVAADSDQNGVLSIEEARAAMPDVVIVDINSDGLLNPAEAENALPGLQLGDEASEDRMNEGVSERHYSLIMLHLQDQAARDQELRRGLETAGQDIPGEPATTPANTSNSAEDVVESLEDTARAVARD